MVLMFWAGFGRCFFNIIFTMPGLWGGCMLMCVTRGWCLILLFLKLLILFRTNIYLCEPLQYLHSVTRNTCTVKFSPVEQLSHKLFGLSLFSVFQWKWTKKCNTIKTRFNRINVYSLWAVMVSSFSSGCWITF